MYSLDTGIRYSTYLLIFKSQTLGSNSGSQQPFMHAEHFETFHSNYIISFIIGFIIGFIMISSWVGRILFVDWDNLKTLLHPSSFMKSITPRYCMPPTIDPPQHIDNLRMLHINYYRGVRLELVDPDVTFTCHVLD